MLRTVVVVVLKALKRDVIRSIIARCELLCEDLLQAEEEQGLIQLLTTSTKITNRWQHRGLCHNAGNKMLSIFVQADPGSNATDSTNPKPNPANPN